MSIQIKGRPWWQLVGLLIVTLGILALLTWLAAIYIPRGVDWHFHFYPDTTLWLSGDTQLFDEETTGFYHPPWGIWFLVPYVLLPEPYGLALLRITSILMLAICAWIFTRPGKQRLWGVLLAIINLHTWDLIYRGQITAFDALGAAFCWVAIQITNPWLMGISYIFLSISPPNTIPFALVMLWYTWQQWKRRDFWYSLVIPAVVGIASFIVFPRWPWRWVDNVVTRPPSEALGTSWFTSIWWAARQLDISIIFPWMIVIITTGITVWAWRRINTSHVERSDQDRLIAYLMLFTTAFFVVTPWALSYRYVLLYAMVVPWLVGWRLDVVMGIHLLTLLPVARVYIGVENSWIDVAYPIAIFAATVLHLTVFPERAAYAVSQPASGG